MVHRLQRARFRTGEPFYILADEKCVPVRVAGHPLAAAESRLRAYVSTSEHV